MKFSVVIPVYRSEPTLVDLHRQLSDMFQEHGYNYEIVFVNDASPDHSWQVLKELHELHDHLQIINLSRNFGQHAALLCGIAHTTGDFIITMDDDLQHPPGEIPKLIEAILSDDNTDVYIGAYISKKHNPFRNLFTSIIHLITFNIFDVPADLQLTSFRIMRKRIGQDILKFNIYKPRIGHLILKTTKYVKNVPVRHMPRAVGRSTYTLSKLAQGFLDNIFTYSIQPMRIVVYMGLILSVTSISLGLYYITLYLGDKTSVAGWTTLVVLVLFLFGMLFFSLGIMGEYLVRVLREGRKMPHYLIREKY